MIFDTHSLSLTEPTYGRASTYAMESGPGVGKSSIVEQVCARLAAEFDQPVGMLIRMVATMSGPDVMGFMMPVKNPATGELTSTFSRSPMMPHRDTIVVFMPDGTIYREGEWGAFLAALTAANKAWPDGLDTTGVPEIGTVFLDEWGQGEHEVQKPLADFLLKATIGSNRLPPGWRVLCASNRLSDKSGVTRPLMHTINRMGILAIDGVYDVWNEDFVQKLPAERRPHYMTVSFAAKHPHIVFKDATPGDGKPYCTPRSLTLMDRELRALRSEEDVKADRMPVDDLSREVCAAWLGEADASQYFVHLKYDDLLPRFEDVVAKPAEAKLPKGDDAQMILAYMLSHHVTKPTARAVMAYMVRMSIEMQTLLMRNLTAQEELAVAVTSTPEFGAWISKHADLLAASRG